MCILEIKTHEMKLLKNMDYYFSDPKNLRFNNSQRKTASSIFTMLYLSYSIGKGALTSLIHIKRVA